MRDDPIVEETHRIRERLAAKFDFDIQAIFADMRSRERLVGDRLKNLQSSSIKTIPSSSEVAPPGIENSSHSTG